MKQLSAIVIFLFTALTIYAQQYSNEVTITVNGSKNLQIAVDGRNYDLTNSTLKGEKTSIAINNLVVGQHSLQVSRTDPDANNTERISTVFNLRPGYDMLVRVNKNGSLGLIETKRTGVNANMPPMNTAEFNNLLAQVRNQRSPAGRKSVISDAFSNTQNYFTSSQVSQLIQQVNGESFRLQLAKLSYRSITDRNNFYQVFDQLNSQESRNDLEDYINDYNQEVNPDSAMSDENFNTLYQGILQQRPVSAQMNSLTNAFNNTANYFTVYQASRLIQLVTAENNRLQLAKLSYRSITDRSNFYQVNELLYGQASKNELEVYVKNYGGGSTQGVAMTDANFNALYQTIQQQRSVSTQMNLLNNAFNNTANYFTTIQASRLIQLVSTESNRLQLAKLSYRSITDKVNFLRLKDLLYSQAGKNELEAYVNNYNSGGTEAVAMSDANFNALYQTIQQQRSVSTQMGLLTNAFNNTANYFTAYQASRLIQLVSAESNRLQLAKLSYRSITDRNNFYQVKDLLYGQASKNDLEAFITNDNSGGTQGVAMSDAGFNALYQTIRDQWPVSTQMNSLSNAFNNSSNYFTSYQASRLIQLVSAESNRLQLAKLSYRSITDRNNFNLVFNTLPGQSAKDELAVYVNNYSTGGGSNTRVPMPESAFNALYQAIFLKFFPNERMNALTIEFNNTANNFSAAQAKQLISLVSIESNRLILAKLSYRSITDRNNFNLLYDLLDSEASRNELEEYVRNYSN
ncbi:MAG: DUF4476 domain-containing protein [Chitinophagaceae bacterium]|nr:DUF4476 domain-containing protein [Chitinophagaceae bacterium]